MKFLPNFVGWGRFLGGWFGLLCDLGGCRCRWQCTFGWYGLLFSLGVVGGGFRLFFWWFGSLLVALFDLF